MERIHDSIARLIRAMVSEAKRPFFLPFQNQAACRSSLT